MALAKGSLLTARQCGASHALKIFLSGMGLVRSGPLATQMDAESGAENHRAKRRPQMANRFSFAMFPVSSISLSIKCHAGHVESCDPDLSRFECSCGEGITN